MGRYLTSAISNSPASVMAPLVPGVPVFGSGTRQIFTTSGTFVSNGQPVQVYVIGGSGGDNTQSQGAGGGAAVAVVTPPAGNVTVTIGAKGASGGGAGGTSTFGAGAYLVNATGGAGGLTTTGSIALGGAGITGTLTCKGDCAGNGGKVGFYGPARSGFPSLPYGIGGGTPIEGGGMIIVEY